MFKKIINETEKFNRGLLKTNKQQTKKKPQEFRVQNVK